MKSFKQVAAVTAFFMCIFAHADDHYTPQNLVTLSTLTEILNDTSLIAGNEVDRTKQACKILLISDQAPPFALKFCDMVATKLPDIWNSYMFVLAAEQMMTRANEVNDETDFIQQIGDLKRNQTNHLMIVASAIIYVDPSTSDQSLSLYNQSLIQIPLKSPKNNQEKDYMAFKNAVRRFIDPNKQYFDNKEFAEKY